MLLFLVFIGLLFLYRTRLRMAQFRRSFNAQPEAPAKPARRRLRLGVKRANNCRARYS